MLMHAPWYVWAAAVLVLAAVAILTWPRKPRTPEAVAVVRARHATPAPFVPCPDLVLDPAEVAVWRADLSAALRHRAPDPEPADDEPEPDEPAPVEHEGATLDWSPTSELRLVGEGQLRPTELAGVDLVDVDLAAEQLHREHAEAEARIAEFANAPIEWTPLDDDLARVYAAADRAQRVLVGGGVLAEHTGAIDTRTFRAILDAPSLVTDFRAFTRPDWTTQPEVPMNRHQRKRARRALGASA